MQAFRHLHVLASEERGLTAVETDSQADVEVPLSWHGGSECKTPCLTPPLEDVRPLTDLHQMLHPCAGSSQDL